jgi:hypothetical protein
LGAVRTGDVLGVREHAPVEIHLPASPEAVAVLRAFAARHARGAGARPEAAERLRVAVGEAATAAVARTPGGPLRLEVRVLLGEVVADIEADSAPLPAAGGISDVLLHAAAADVQVEALASGGSRVRLRLDTGAAAVGASGSGAAPGPSVQS